MKLLTYYHTLKYLKFTQLYHRVLKKIKHPTPRTVAGVCSSTNKSWISQELYRPKFIDETMVEFLNSKGEVNNPIDWNDLKKDKLWLYNLHYFDDLNSFGSQKRRVLQRHWINKWIDENPAIVGGNGWEAYTLSLRIVNWTKAFLSGLDSDQKWLDSLAQQADFLSQVLEKHLLGNHYFVNLKALLFAGCFFQGNDANKWLGLAIKDYEKELDEQVLNDGGSFELTPMYHAIMLVDLLDLYNLFVTFPSRIPSHVVAITQNKIVKMLVWLNIMSHSDDQVSFFNDSAFGVAPKNSSIRGYAKKLGFKIVDKVKLNDSIVVSDLLNSGYVAVKSKEFSLIADLAEVGPSYQPGHAHADTLSFELALFGKHVFVNSGVSEYGVGKERLRQRQTAAHNTVVVDGLDSSQVWSGFRVAKRARIIERYIDKNKPDSVFFSASHDGFKQQGVKCIHKRNWSVERDSILVEDELIGSFNAAKGYLHLHPDITVINIENNEVKLSGDGLIINLRITDAIVCVKESSWHPEFGIRQENKVLCFEFIGSEMCIQINWCVL